MSNNIIKSVLIPFGIMVCVGLLGLNAVASVYYQGDAYLLRESACLFGAKTHLLSGSQVFACFSRAADEAFISQSRKYPFISIQNNHYISESLPGMLSFHAQYRSYVAALKYNEMWGGKNEYLSRLFYATALMALRYDKNSVGLTESLLKTSALLQPQLSFYHVELANYYLKQAQPEKAEEALRYCQLFEYPRFHCKQYEQSDLKSFKIEPVGFLRTEIDKYNYLP